MVQWFGPRVRHREGAVCDMTKGEKLLKQNVIDASWGLTMGRG